jgi:hypothetical protein
MLTLKDQSWPLVLPHVETELASVSVSNSLRITKMDLDQDFAIFFREHLCCAGMHFPSQENAHYRHLDQVLPPGIYHAKFQSFALLHIAHRCGELFPTLATGKREE